MTTLHTHRFTAPLSLLTHTLFESPLAHAWLAFSENNEQVTFVAKSAHADWRLAAVQAAHELVEAYRHHFVGIMRDDLDAHDLTLLNSTDTDAALSNHFHAHGRQVELSLALALGIPLEALGAARHGLLSSPTLNPNLIRPPGDTAAAIASMFPLRGRTGVQR